MGLVVCLSGCLLSEGLAFAQGPQGGRNRAQGPGQFGGQFGGRGPAAAADQTPQKPEDYCSAQGTVLNGATGEPLRKAAVSLRTTGRRPGSRLSAVTDDGGRFRIDNVEPGLYRLQAERNGFVRQDYGATRPGRSGKTLTLEKGKHLTGVVFRMTPQGVVTGRVTDEDGEPVLSASVTAVRQGYVNGQKQLVPAGRAMTNDLGEYRIHSLPPGRYYLSASLRSGGPPDSSAEEDSSYVPTYYPAATDPAAASLMEVTAGGVLAGIEFRLQRARTVSVRGKVDNIPADRRGVGLWLIPVNQSAGMISMRRNTRLDRQGNFEFHGVPAGSYVLGADSMGRGDRYSARMEVQIGASDLNGVSVQMVPGIDLPIQFRAEEDAPIAYQSLRVTLSGSVFPFFGGNSWPVNESGAAKATQLAPETFRVSVTGLPANFYVKSIRMAERDVTAEGLNLASGGGALQILLSPQAGQVSGVVMNSDGTPLTTATVVVAPANSRDWQDSSRIKTGSVDTSGAYSVGGLPPGDYLAYAFEDLEPGASEDPEYLKAFETRASKVTIQAGGNETLKLTAIGSDQQSLAQDRGEIGQR